MTFQWKCPKMGKKRKKRKMRKNDVSRGVSEKIMNT